MMAFRRRDEELSLMAKILEAQAFTGLQLSRAHSNLAHRALERSGSNPSTLGVEIGVLVFQEGGEV
jgi:hypothetical protein